ncbi:hypothetical protein Btru_059264 [Bulinus truncatus]|nr:hypothetical protein Btru_059264 [Bulinus truncatus]
MRLKKLVQISMECFNDNVRPTFRTSSTFLLDHTYSSIWPCTKRGLMSNVLETGCSSEHYVTITRCRKGHCLKKTYEHRQECSECPTDGCRFNPACCTFNDITCHYGDVTDNRQHVPTMTGIRPELGFKTKLAQYDYHKLADAEQDDKTYEYNDGYRDAADQSDFRFEYPFDFQRNHDT